MPIKPPAPRHFVENLAHSVRVTLPGKKGLFKIVWFCIWLLGWLYMTGSVIIFLAVMMGGATGLFGVYSPDATSNSGFLIVIACLIPFLIALLGMGGIVIYSLLLQIVGKEIIEANSQTLTITKQIFGWKNFKEYATEAISDLRVNTQQLSSIPPIASIQKLLGQDGMIAFDYGAKTFRFGLEIDEAEAKQIIFVLRQHLPQQKAG
jgi:hypothetical protein